jgi:hypothetical protein
MSPAPDTPEPDTPHPVPASGRLDIPPERDDPPPLTAEEIRQMDAEGLTLDDVIRVIEAELG